MMTLRNVQCGGVNRILPNHNRISCKADLGY